jgi:hypothetical protein
MLQQSAPGDRARTVSDVIRESTSHRRKSRFATSPSGPVRRISGASPSTRRGPSLTIAARFAHDSAG